MTLCIHFSIHILNIYLLLSLTFPFPTCKRFPIKIYRVYFVSVFKQFHWHIYPDAPGLFCEWVPLIVHIVWAVCKLCWFNFDALAQGNAYEPTNKPMTNAISFNLYREILYVLRKILTPFCASFPPPWSTLNQNGLCSMYYMFTCFWYFVRTLCICFDSRRCIFILGSSPSISV